VVKLQQRANVEGKVIRNIVTLDPFGYSDIDTTVNPKIGQNEQKQITLEN
jgi:hypothetical protein